jgi:hypothetical protein
VIEVAGGCVGAGFKGQSGRPTCIHIVRKGVDKSHDHPLVLPLLEVEICGAMAGILPL